MFLAVYEKTRRFTSTQNSRIIVLYIIFVFLDRRKEEE
jgi:hypothetical protein